MGVDLLRLVRKCVSREFAAGKPITDGDEVVSGTFLPPARRLLGHLPLAFPRFILSQFALSGIG